MMMHTKEKKEGAFFIGIDIGTSSISGVICDFTTKHTESITRNNNTSLSSSDSWEKIQDPDKIMQLVLGVINDFSSKYSEIKGIGIAGQMHGVLYVDKEGRAVSPLYTWQDGRGNQLYRNDKTYAEYLSAETGYSLSSGFGLVTHFFNKKNRLVPPTAVKLCTIMDYIVMKLSGRKMPLMDYSNAASLGFFNLFSLCFDVQSLERMRINPSILPEIGKSAILAGYYNQTIPIYSAIGDNQASFLGSVRNINSSIHITVGTSSQISAYSEKYISIESLDTRPFPGGGYILVGAALCGGQSFAMLKTFFENTLEFLEIDLPHTLDIYKTMTSIAYERDTSGTPIVETFFDGTRLQPWKRGSILNISTTNFTPKNLILGLVKGISRELYHFFNLIPEDIKKDKTILVGSGNGIKMNPLLCKAFEEQFNCNMYLSQHQEESAFGACICAIAGEKYIKSFLKRRDADEMVFDKDN